MNLRDIPNIISFLRIIFVIPIILLILDHKYLMALILMFIAGVSDGLDGFLAKHFHWKSRLGSIIDPIADKILLISCFITLAWMNYVPFWLVFAIIIRDLIIIFGAMGYHFFIGQFDMVPTIISKTNTLAQIVLVLSIVFSLGVYALPEMLLNGLIYLVLFTTAMSGIDYIWVWSKKAGHEYRKPSRG